MATKRGRRPRPRTAPALHQSPDPDSASKATGLGPSYDLTGVPPQPVAPLRLGDRERFECPFCGSRDTNARMKLDRDGEPRLFIGCFGESCPIPRRQYLPALSEALGLNASAEPEEIAAALIGRKRVLTQATFSDGDLNLSRAVVGIVTTKYRRP